MFQKMNKMMLVVVAVSLMIILLPTISESLLFMIQNKSKSNSNSNRRAFFASVATTTTAIATCGACARVANAGIDVSGLKVGNPTGRAPNQPPSGPLAGTPLGFQVAGGPRPEEEVRKIDEARYQAAGKGPSFLVGVPREERPKMSNEDDTKWMR